MTKTDIDWCDFVWNPVTGCTKVSSGCANCYAERVANRFWGNRKFADIQVHQERLGEPLKRKKPSVIFVNSMSDLFHEDVDGSFIEDVFIAMNRCPQHIFLILTKRPGLAESFFDIPLTPRPNKNIWLGVSIEDQKTAEERIPKLLNLPTKNLFVSAEPLLWKVSLDKWLDHIKWVIVGGESGSGARPMHPEWVRSIREQCQTANVPFFFKQWGQWTHIKPRIVEDGRWGVLCADTGNFYPETTLWNGKEQDGELYMYSVGKSITGHLLDGREYREVPGVIAEVNE